MAALPDDFFSISAPWGVCVLLTPLNLLIKVFFFEAVILELHANQ
jgi:hypothetical protein